MGELAFPVSPCVEDLCQADQHRAKAEHIERISRAGEAKIRAVSTRPASITRSPPRGRTSASCGRLRLPAGRRAASSVGLYSRTAKTSIPPQDREQRADRGGQAHRIRPPSRPGRDRTPAIAQHPSSHVADHSPAAPRSACQARRQRCARSSEPVRWRSAVGFHHGIHREIEHPQHRHCTHSEPASGQDQHCQRATIAPPRNRASAALAGTRSIGLVADDRRHDHPVAGPASMRIGSDFKFDAIVWKMRARSIPAGQTSLQRLAP